ncbi:5'-nucleotidase, lipoprotein e(P4) family [Pinibacter soli]|uniref:5'-nucleotidase, lipoprotein e(P4) family n=1 Tax=Pinibacter soli TaxID=3044211 RepID=A0ABT6R7F6_9BACT|nr:5'-nucleotidase, lipoprotein e(P4) family [Pinibacter soli]MDI3318492.1 5'-nucleotidase, lipoprotein e(P4) family [Pinibacter soli]
MRKYLFILVALAAACSPSKRTQSTTSSSIVIDGKLWASVYQQKAAEYKALCYQAYNIAQLRLDQSLQAAGKPKAVVTDIDETFLDNSPYAAKQSLNARDYEAATWSEWTSLGQADTLAGALGFFKYAASKNVEVFYITNREEKERAGTLKNLQQFGFPFADDAHLIMRQPGSSSSKESRRQTVLQTHDIILLLGDNLGDFSVLFDKKSLDERNTNTFISAQEFGKRFIVLPNPSYGDWEGALYNYNYKLSPAQKDSVVRANVKGF